MPRIFNQKRTKNGSIILETKSFVQKRTKNGSTLETRGRKNGTSHNPAAKLIYQRAKMKITLGSRLHG